MIELLIITMYIVIFLAMSALALSLAWRMMITRKASGIVNNIPVRKIKITVMAIVIIILALSYALCNTEPLHIGKQIYTEESWIRIANMLVTTGMAIIGIATATIITSIIVRNNRK